MCGAETNPAATHGEEMVVVYPVWPVPSPAQTSPSSAQDPPARLDHHDTAKIRKACQHVTHLYPGAAGKILATYLSDWLDWSYRVDQSNLAAELVRDVLAQIPEQR